jgi:hypothetical protein
MTKFKLSTTRDFKIDFKKKVDEEQEEEEEEEQQQEEEEEQEVCSLNIKRKT